MMTLIFFGVKVLVTIGKNGKWHCMHCITLDIHLVTDISHVIAVDRLKSRLFFVCAKHSMRCNRRLELRTTEFDTTILHRKAVVTNKIKCRTWTVRSRRVRKSPYLWPAQLFNFSAQYTFRPYGFKTFQNLHQTHTHRHMDTYQGHFFLWLQFQTQKKKNNHNTRKCLTKVHGRK